MTSHAAGVGAYGVRAWCLIIFKALSVYTVSTLDTQTHNPTQKFQDPTAARYAHEPMLDARKP